MNVFYIAKERPFLKTLVSGLVQDYRDHPDRLSDVQILLPTRRAVRHATDLFLEENGNRAILLPRLRAVGDIDDEELEIFLTAVTGQPVAISEAISPLQRRLVLARMVRHSDPGMNYLRAADMATALGEFLDQIADEGLSLDGLDHLVPDQFAAHWQVTLKFLSVLRTVWPEYLAAHGLIDPADRRARLLRQLSGYWRDHPPAHPVIMAGVSGSLPAVADLMKTVAGMKNGQVILAGFDPSQIGFSAAGDPQHPFYETELLIEKLGLEIDQIRAWGSFSATPSALPSVRSWLWNEALRPAAGVENWAALPGHPYREKIADHLPAIRIAECETSRDEATSIAIHAHRVLQDPAHTVSIVTPDRNLAAEIMAACARFGIEVNDSAGIPLPTTDSARFLDLVLRVVSGGYHPVDLLSLFHHPFFGVDGMDLETIYRLDRALRGIRPPDDVAGLLSFFERQGVSAGDLSLIKSVLSILSALEPFLAQGAGPLVPTLKAHLEIAEKLCRKDSDDVPFLWRDETGQALSALLTRLIDLEEVLPDIEGREYAEFFHHLLRSERVNQSGVGHPRLALLGVYESRLATATHVVLAGMNEGIWPMGIQPDPWLSRGMRKNFGLPEAERKVGRMAADFLALVAADHVLMTRSIRQGEEIGILSRWIQRLDTVLSVLGINPENLRDQALPALARRLDQPEKGIEQEKTQRPAPRPPVTIRPRRLSATQVETLIRNPYAFYARKILNLQRLDPYDQDIDGRVRGNILHTVLEKFIRAHAQGLPADAFGSLISLLRAELEIQIPDPVLRTRIFPRLHRALIRFIRDEQEWRARGFSPLALETAWEWPLDVAGAVHLITARLDRLDRDRGGYAAVIDYKTGSNTPSGPDVLKGKSPQIAIEALIVARGSAQDQTHGPLAVEDAVIWPVLASDKKAQVWEKEKVSVFQERAAAGLKNILAAFQNEGTPYYPIPDPDFEPAFDDYAHLSRKEEWWGVDE